MSDSGPHNDGDVESLKAHIAELEAQLAELRRSGTGSIAEQRLQMLTETLPVGIGVTALDGTILYANRSGAEQHGVELETFIGSKSPDLFEDPRDREVLIEQLQKHGRVDNFDTWWRKADGTRVRMRLTSQPVTLDGKPCIMGTGIDITRQYEAELRISAISSAGPVAILISRRADDVLVHVNAPACELLGASETEVLGCLSFELWAEPNHRARVLEHLQQYDALRGEEFEIIVRSGRRRWVSGDIVSLTFEGEPCIMKALVDVNEACRNRLMLAQTLKAKERLLRELNHRVRNNLQLITSLLSLQTNKAESIAEKGQLERSRARVLAIGAVHELLAKRPEVSHLSMRGVAEFLVAKGGRLQCGSPPPARCVIEGELPLVARQATTFALLLNELLAEAFRHSTSVGASLVRIQLQEKAGYGRLGISYDGPGPNPSSPQIQESEIIDALASQLEGQLSLLMGEGGQCEVRVDFPTSADSVVPHPA